MSMKVSVITPTLNSARFLSEALESARAVSPQEHFVIDGGSQDATAEIAGSAPGVRFVSRPGCSLYAALNHGLRLASGEYIVFLNSDDCFAPGGPDVIARLLARANGAELLSGDAELCVTDASGSLVSRRYRQGPFERLCAEEILFGVPIMNARIYARSLFERLGGFDESLKIAADREFLIRVLGAGVKEVREDAAVYRYRSHPGSLTLAPNRERAGELIAEHRRIAARYLDRDTPEGFARELRDWLRDSMISGFAAELRAGRASSAVRMIASDLYADPALILSLHRLVGGKLKRRKTMFRE